MERRSVLKYLGLGLAATCPICLGAAKALAAEAKGAVAAKGHDAAAHPHWSYEGAGSPEKWGQLEPDFRACELGLQQSPVDLHQPIKASLGDIPVSWRPMPLRIVNNGHTIQVNCDGGSGMQLDGKAYRLLQFHFHAPSEHLLAGKRFELECHFVHASDDGNLAVLGVFMTPGGANAALAPVFDAMPRQAAPERASSVMISPAELLPKDRGYFRYMGSLTTPPCSEKVTWTVFKTPIEVSSSQVSQFASIFANNARPPLPLHRRLLLQSM